MFHSAPKPTAIILVYPVITMGEYTHKGSRDNLLGKRKFALEVLPDIVLRLTLDSSILSEETKKKKWRLW